MKLQINQSIDVEIIARKKWNATQIEISENEEYEFTAKGHWRDLTKKTDANGYTSSYMQLFDSRKRVRQEMWFSLIGTLDKETYFLIGKNKSIPFKNSGGLYCFANDAFGFYWNNSGRITLNIKRTK